MRKILLVDDELLVRTNIKLLLTPYSDRLEICGEASNGKEALDLIPILQPDIILSDMQMPEMDGVDLCKAIHHQFPHISFIALSNYDDFELVRSVLKTGGIDYLLKHQLNGKSLSDALSGIKITTSEPHTAHMSATATMNSLKRTFVINLLSGVFITKEMLDYNIQVLNLPIQSTRLCPIVLTIDNYNQMRTSQSVQQQNTLIFSIQNIGNEILDTYKNGILTHLDGGNYCILLSFEHMPSTSRIKDFIHKLLLQISSKLKLFLNISTSYSIGEVCQNYSEVPQVFEKAISSLNQRFYKGNQSIIHSDDICIQEQPLSGLERKDENKLWMSASCGDYPEVQKQLHDFFQHIRETKTGINNAQMVFTDMIGVLLRICKEKNLSLETIFYDSIKPAQALSQLNTLDQIQEWFTKTFQHLCRELNRQLSGDSVYVQKALSIIHQNYDKPVSLQSIAEEIGISFGYLSTIFTRSHAPVDSRITLIFSKCSKKSPM